MQIRRLWSGIPSRGLIPILTVFSFGVYLPLPATAAAQGTCQRILVQDSTLNNLIDPAGYRTGELGTLAEVRQTGMGPQSMILIPGLGFGAEIFDDFMARHASEFRMYAVTLPGFGGSAAPPSPAESVSFGDQIWTNGALSAIESLIEREGIQNPILVGHWMTGTQLALRLAMKHPENTRAVVILSGSARFVPTDTTRMPFQMPLDKRVAGVDRYMAPLWFKTVTRETWDDNNFLPSDYAVNPILGLRLWRWAAEPELHVWVRYLCEFYAQDISLELDQVTVPTLILKPGLEGNFFDPGQNYMLGFCHQSWERGSALGPRMEMQTVPNTRACMWFDQPEDVDRRMGDFLKTLN